METQSTKPTRKTPRSKNPARVDRQLENLAPKKGDEVMHLETLTPQDVKEAPEAASKPEPNKSQLDFTRGQLGKAKRAFVKAGKPDASDAVKTKWLAELRTAGIDVMQFTSSRLAKVIRGEITTEQLRQ